MRKATQFFRIDNKTIPITKKEVRLYCVIRNERPRIKFFLKYYKKLGVDRFFFIDNNSTDNVDKELLKYPDVHVYRSMGKFYQAKAVHLKKVVNTFSHNSWCLIVDADEFLRFPFDKSLKIKGIISYLEEKKTYILKTSLLDMYSHKKIQETHYQPGKDLFNICQYFDRAGYTQQDGEVYGGIRSRVFGLQKILLTKYPLFKNVTSFQPSFSDVHQNPGAKDVNTTGVLFHFKFLENFVERAHEEAQREAHWRKAVEYKAYIKKDLRTLQLYSDEHSIKFKNFIQLYKLNLITINLSLLVFFIKWEFTKFLTLDNTAK